MLIIHQFQNVGQKCGKAKYSSLTFVCWGGEGGHLHQSGIIQPC
jgi:hypothetical protein